MMKRTILIALLGICAQVYSMEMEQNTLNQVILRQYTEADQTQINQIYQADWEKLFMGRPFDAELTASLLKPERGQKSFKEAKVIEKDKNVIAFITYYYFSERTEHQGYIEQLAVSKDHRRKGYAKQLMTDAITELKKNNVDRIDIFARKDNAPAVALYDSLGFNERESTPTGLSWLMTMKLR